jgi:hypothetical protein
MLPLQAILFSVQYNVYKVPFPNIQELLDLREEFRLRYQVELACVANKDTNSVNKNIYTNLVW